MENKTYLESLNDRLVALSAKIAAKMGVPVKVVIFVGSFWYAASFDAEVRDVAKVANVSVKDSTLIYSYEGK